MNGKGEPFEIGVVMAGAVSAGAYTAGVMDFFLEALEAWCRAKAENDTVPNHDVYIRAISGASAGAMTAAIVARSLATFVTPVGDVNAPPDSPNPDPAAEKNTFRNPFYAAWVQSIDIRHLLQSKDLEKKGAKVVSLLDSTVLEQIGDNVLRSAGVERPQGQKPAYVGDEVHLFFTTTNLRGVPYGFPFSGQKSNYKHMMTAYADYTHFKLRWGNASQVGGDGAVLLAADGVGSSAAWSKMMSTALASGAFPIGLAPRLLSRFAAEYDGREWDIPDDHPLRIKPVNPCGPSDAVDEDRTKQLAALNNTAEVIALQAVPTVRAPIPPVWPPGIRDPDSAEAAADPAFVYEYWNVDGGVMNNEPMELVRRQLSRGKKRNPRDGRLARRAVVMVDPFPNESGVAKDYDTNISLVKTILQLFNALKEQTRFKPDELKLASMPEVYSRFVISPIYAGPTAQESLAIASAIMGGFGGFIAESFRKHDFQLGRRNCQRFLQKHFVLPIENDVFAAWNNNGSLVKDYCFEERNEVTGRMETLAPIIPLVGTLSKEIPLPVRPRGALVDLDDIKKRIGQRIGNLVPRLLDDIPAFLPRGLLKGSWYLAVLLGQRRRLVTVVSDKIEEEIARLG